MHPLLDYEEVGAGQSARLGSHETELNQIETALLTAAKSGKCPPSSSRVFRALSDASIVCAEVIDEYADKTMPRFVRNDLSRVHCAMTDLGVSLASYSALCLKESSLG
jgi:hypothetical protein